MREETQVVVFDVTFIQAVANYLQERPYREVAVFLSHFAQARPMPASQIPGYQTEYQLPPSDQKLASAARVNGKQKEPA